MVFLPSLFRSQDKTYPIQRYGCDLRRYLVGDKRSIIVVFRVDEQLVVVVKGQRRALITRLEQRRHDIGVQGRCTKGQGLRQVEVAALQDPKENARLVLARRDNLARRDVEVEGVGVVRARDDAGQAELLDGGARVAGAEGLACEGGVVALELQGEGRGGVVCLGRGREGEAAQKGEEEG